jgi:hypothetical protein
MKLWQLVGNVYYSQIVKANVLVVALIGKLPLSNRPQNSHFRFVLTCSPPIPGSIFFHALLKIATKKIMDQSDAGLPDGIFSDQKSIFG